MGASRPLKSRCSEPYADLLELRIRLSAQPIHCSRTRLRNFGLLWNLVVSAGALLIEEHRRRECRVRLCPDKRGQRRSDLRQSR